MATTYVYKLLSTNTMSPCKLLKLQIILPISPQNYRKQSRNTMYQYIPYSTSISFNLYIPNFQLLHRSYLLLSNNNHPYEQATLHQIPTKTNSYRYHRWNATKRQCQGYSPTTGAIYCLHMNQYWTLLPFRSLSNRTTVLIPPAAPKCSRRSWKLS